MTQAEPIPGQAVSLPATLSGILHAPGVPPERQTVSVRLRDGQSIETNVGNLEWPDKPAAESAPEQASEPAATAKTDSAPAAESAPLIEQPKSRP